MNKAFRKNLHRLVGTGLALMLSLTLPAAAYAAEAVPDTPGESASGAPVESSGAPAESSPKAVPEAPQSVPEETPAPSPAEASETAEEETSEASPAEAPETAAEETAEASPAEATETAEKEASEASPAEAAETVEEETADAAGPEETAVRAAAASAAETDNVASGSADDTGDSSDGNPVAGTISIGGTSFDAGEDESSHWSDGKGWKNIAGQYVAMVDYDGSEVEISADGGTVTLAVAGVNRIGTLKGNCSFNIVGTGVVLIDSIEIDEGQTVSLMPDTSLYTEGSAAVFLKQDNEEYLLINREIPAILDEKYTLEDVKLKVPEGSSVTLGCVAAWMETWTPDGSDGTVTELMRSVTSPRAPVHEGGQISDIKQSAGKLVLGNGSTLTVDSGVLISLKAIGTLLHNAVADLVVQGTLTLNGIIEGGFMEICDGGSLKGNGTVRNVDVTLEPSGNLSEDIHIEKSSLTVKGEGRSISAQLDSSNLFLGSGITVEELSVSGRSLVIFEDDNKIGNITLSAGSSLSLHTNAYLNGSGISPLLDRILTISGEITGGIVSVLSGCVDYIGKKTDVLPVVPGGYASRVYVTGMDTESTELPLVITEKDAAVWANKEQIPVIKLSVTDYVIPDKVGISTWFIDSAADLAPISRAANQSFTCASFLKKYGLGIDDPDPASCLEVFLYSQTRGFERLLLWADDTASFTTEDVYMIRVLNVISHCEEGGSAANHTDTSFTGSGVLGGSGAGSVQAGVGKVIFVRQASPDPVPDDNGNGKDNTGNDKGKAEKTAKTSQNGRRRAAGPEDGADSLTMTVSLRESGDGDSGEVPADLPQIYTLSVTKAGVPVIVPDGITVNVVFPFAVPAAWGEPGKIAEDSLYAVFADEEGVLTAYAAEYDPATGEISFESEQAGDFVIVRFAYEEEPFTEEFYRALAKLEEVRAFLSMLREE